MIHLLGHPEIIGPPATILPSKGFPFWMIVSGVKHACATCIRGHRSSSCTHVERPLFEIRKKGRPVSQCPHCRDLRNIKTLHTKCDCGDSSIQLKSNGCRCSSGHECRCAGPVQIYQYIPPSLSSGSDSTASSDHASMNANASLLTTFGQVKTNIAMPYPSVAQRKQQDHERTVPDTAQNPSLAAESGISAAIYSTAPPSDQPPSRTVRSIGINTDPLPTGIFPKDLFQPLTLTPDASALNGVGDLSGNPGTLPLFNPAPNTIVKSLPSDHQIPLYSSYYGFPSTEMGEIPPESGPVLDHYSHSQSHLDFDQGYWNNLFDVPGCSLPGVICQCGDDCSCLGCRTHTSNGANVAAEELQRLDFSLHDHMDHIGHMVTEQDLNAFQAYASVSDLTREQQRTDHSQQVSLPLAGRSCCKKETSI